MQNFLGKQGNFSKHERSPLSHTEHHIRQRFSRSRFLYEQKSTTVSDRNVTGLIAFLRHFVRCPFDFSSNSDAYGIDIECQLSV